jgi:hypothetical protein
MGAAAFCITVEVSASGVVSRTAVKAGVVDRNNSSAPGKLALRLIEFPLVQSIHALSGDRTLPLPNWTRTW